MFREQRFDPSDVQPFAAVWRSDGTGGQLIVPDGSADVIVDLDTEALWVVGPMTRPMRTPAGTRRRLLGVRLRPWAAHAVLGPAAADLTDGRHPLRSVNRRLDALVRRARPELLPVALRRAGVGSAFDPRVRRIVQLLERRPDGAPGSIAALALVAGLTERHLERLFRRHVGLGPKKLYQVLRLKRALARSAPSLAECAIAAGYSDQPHFCRDARALTGLPPGALLAVLRGQRMSDPSKTERGSTR